jgi:hypothetical protein
MPYVGNLRKGMPLGVLFAPDLWLLGVSCSVDMNAHRSHPALRHGAKAGLKDPLLIQYPIDVLCVQYDSIMLGLPRTFKSVAVRAG